MRPEAYIRAIEAEKAKLASEALSAPAARDGFEYGRVSGLHAGLERAKQIVLDLVNEDDERRANL